MRSTFRFLRVRGIAIGAHWSWLVVAVLVAWSLAAVVFPTAYPGLGGDAYLVMGVVAAALFFGSVLLHELGHALVALREGMELDEITLWLLGGVAHLRGRPRSPGVEFRVAIAGPLVTLLLACVCYGVALTGRIAGWPPQVIAVAEYLALLNVVVLVFNLMPALPLDGGRVLRAFLWHRKGGFPRATRLSAAAGRGFGLALVADALLLFAGAMTLVLAVSLPAVVVAAGALTTQRAAAIGLVVSLVASLFLPLFAFRFSGLRLPLLPGDAKQLGEDIDPVPQEVVVSRGTASIRFLTALCLGLGIAQALLGLAVIVPGGRWPLILALTVAAWLLLRSRHMRIAVQRWAVVTPAVVLAGGAAVRWSMEHDFFVRAAVLLPALATIGVLLAIGGATLPGRRLAPYWGRWAELLETLVAVAVLPLLGAVLGLYQAVRIWASGFA